MMVRKRPKPVLVECPKCHHLQREEDFGHFLDSNEAPVCCGEPDRQRRIEFNEQRDGE
jgi:hypothetical protein